MLTVDQSNGSMIEMESQDMVFIEEELPNKDEVDRNLEFHEIMDQEEGAPHDIVKNGEKISWPQQPQPHRSTGESIFCCRFEVERKALIVVLQDEEEPKTIHEALLSHYMK